MDQDKNNFNPNNFNTQGNNEISNSQSNENSNVSSNNRSSKRISLILITGIIIIVLFVIGISIYLLLSPNKEYNNDENQNINASGDNNITDNENNNSKNEDYKNLLGVEYKIPMKEIYVNSPYYRENKDSTWHEVEQGYTEYWHIDDEMIIAFTSDRNSTTNNLNEAHRLSTKKLIQNLQNENLNYFTITSDETVKINGIEMYKFIGKVNIGHDTKADKFAIGYSFVIDGLPCNITGFVFRAEETDEVINEITKTVEAMVQTVRTEK